MGEKGRGGIKRDTEMKVPKQSEIAGYLQKFSLRLWAVLSSWELYRPSQKNKIDAVCALDPRNHNALQNVFQSIT
jgi:hypothetical protein